jgi:hypothetical protein
MHDVSTHICSTYCSSNNFHKENTCGMSTLYFISSNVMERGTKGRTIPFLPGLEFTVALLESSLLQSAVSGKYMQGLILNYTLTIRLGDHITELCILALSYIFLTLINIESVNTCRCCSIVLNPSSR